METKNNTFIHAVGFIVACVAFMGLFGAISLAIMFIGIYWAFQLTFTVGWWAGAVTYISLLLAYIFTMRYGLKLLGKGNK